MNVHVVTSPNFSRAMGRVEKALRVHAPDRVKFTSLERSDLTIVQVVGYEASSLIWRLQEEGRRYAVIQYCLRTTQRASCADWIDLWRGASVVWSYYDLKELCREDGVGNSFEHYDAPLGVDPVAFSDRPTALKIFALLSSGYVAYSECVGEAVAATAALQRRQFHLGPDLQFPSHVTHRLGVDDAYLARTYRACYYVLGLRRVEGFELPAAEGLLCGARPIVFDRPHYRRWFGPWAEFIPEGTSEQVTESLKKVISNTPKPVSQKEREGASELFSWPRVVRGFWQRILS